MKTPAAAAPAVPSAPTGPACSAPTSIRGWQRASWIQVAHAEISHEDDILDLARATPWERWFGASKLRVDTSAIRARCRACNTATCAGRRHLRPPARARGRASRHRHRAPGCARAPVPDRPYRHVVPGHLRGIAVQARLAPGRRGPLRETWRPACWPWPAGIRRRRCWIRSAARAPSDRSRLDRAGRASGISRPFGFERLRP